METPQQLKRFLRSPITAAAFPVAAIVIGLLASFYHQEILSAWPFTWFDGHGFIARGPLVVQAAWFWGLLISLAISLTWRETVRAGDAEDIRKDFHRRIDELKLLTETSPPKDFLRQYDELSGMVIEASTNAIRAARKLGETDDEVDDDPLTKTSRFVLDAMLQLARRWDTTSDVHSISERVYRANVMWCIPKADITEDDRKLELFEIGKRFYEFDDIDAMFEVPDGFLKVDLALATKESTDGLRDTELTDLILIFDSSNKKKTRNLAGAPQAAKTGSMSYVSSTEQIGEYVRTQKSFNRKEVKKIVRFYKSDGKGRSIISIPVPFDFGNRKTNLPIAVVNLYRDHEGIMGTEARAQQFAHLMVPYIGVLRSLMIEMKGH